jgi:hypothetical protein
MKKKNTNCKKTLGKKDALIEDMQVGDSKIIGRPTKYRPEFCKQMHDYFNVEVRKEIDVEIKSGLFEKRYVINTFPTITRFASNIGVTRETIYDWAAKKDGEGHLIYPDFSYALTCARDMQETLLIEGGLSGAYESRFLMFLAPNISRLKNKFEAEVDVTVTATNTDKLDKIYAEGIERMQANALSVAGRAKGLGLQRN